MLFHLVQKVCCACCREKSSAGVAGTENWKIGDLLLCLCSILPVRHVICFIAAFLFIITVIFYYCSTEVVFHIVMSLLCDVLCLGHVELWCFVGSVDTMDFHSWRFHCAYVSDWWYHYVAETICLVLCYLVPPVLWHCWLGGRKGIQPVKNWVAGCWHGYLSGVRCRLACGPVDAIATHCLLLQ